MAAVRREIPRVVLALPTKAALRWDQCTLDFDRQNLPPTQQTHCSRLRIAIPEVVAPA